MKKTVISISVLFSLMGAFPLAAQTQMEPTYEVSNVMGSAIAFGSVPVGSSVQIPIGGTNLTPYTLSVFAALGGMDAGDFSIINTCSGIPLVTGASCSGIVKFAPRSAGPKKAELIVVMRGVQPAPEACVTGNPNAPGLACEETIQSTNQFLYTQMHSLSGVGQ